jgi:hypothetical protein
MIFQHLQITPNRFGCHLEFVGDVRDGDVAGSPYLREDQPPALVALLCVHSDLLVVAVLRRCGARGADRPATRGAAGMTMAARVRKVLGWSAAGAVLAAVFALYTRPGVMVMLADQLWACFR